MNIAMIVPSLANKGPNIVVRDLVRGLIINGHQCKVYYFDNIIELEFDCPIHRLLIFDKVNFSEFDIVHSHMIRPDLWVAIHKPFIGKCGCKFVSTLHQDIDANLKSDYNVFKAIIGSLLWFSALKRQDAIVVLNEFYKRKNKKKISSVDLNVIYNGRDVDKSKQIDDLDIAVIEAFRSKYNTIGTMANIVPIKGLDQIIKALVKLPMFGVIFIGEGSERLKLEQLSKQLGVENQCLWLGYRSDSYRYLNCFDVYAITSYSEGFPLSVIEASLYERSIVCSDLFIFREIFKEDHIELFKINNIDSLSGAIQIAYDKKNERGRVIAEYTKNHYSIDVMTREYTILYKKLLTTDEDKR